MQKSDASPAPNAVLVVGAGYVGARLAALLAQEGVRVWGLKRNPDHLPAGIRPVTGDVTAPETLRGLPEADAVVYAVAPASPSPTSYRAAYADGVANVLAAMPGPVQRLVLVSSTGVYGHDDGRWVDEGTDPEPPGETARLILEGEALALERARTGVILRLGGIYGPGRTRTVRRVLSGEAGCPPADLYGNRIHRDDAASAVRHILRLSSPLPVYLGVDREPAPLRDVYRWIAARAGLPDPCEEGRAAAAVGAGGRRGSNKRCSSRRLVESGFEFDYPTYREGYAPLVDELVAG